MAVKSESELAKVAEEIAEKRGEGAPDTFTASNGVVLHLKKVSFNLSVEAGRSIPEPEPPMVYLADRERDEINYDDPKYKQALVDRMSTIGDLTNMLYLTIGVKSVDVPEGMETWESNEWAEEIEEGSNGRIVIPESGRRRRVLWIKYVALADIQDFQAALSAIGRYSSSAVAVRDVEDVEKSFRDQETRNGDNNSNGTEGD